MMRSSDCMRMLVEWCVKSCMEYATDCMLDEKMSVLVNIYSQASSLNEVALYSLSDSLIDWYISMCG